MSEWKGSLLRPLGTQYRYIPSSLQKVDSSPVIRGYAIRRYRCDDVAQQGRVHAGLGLAVEIGRLEVAVEVGHAQGVRRVVVVEALVLEARVHRAQPVAEERQTQGQHQAENGTGHRADCRPLGRHYLIRRLRICGVNVMVVRANSKDFPGFRGHDTLLIGLGTIVYELNPTLRIYFFV